MEIRTANVADVPGVLPMVARICALHQQLDPAKYCFRDNPAELYGNWLTERATDAQSVFLVADAAGRGETPKVVAFLIGTVEREIPIYQVKEFGFIHDLWVEPDYRNEGVARQMVEVAIERFTAIGVKQVRLDTAAANDTARALFAACGFRPSTLEMLIET